MLVNLCFKYKNRTLYFIHILIENRFNKFIFSTKKNLTKDKYMAFENIANKIILDHPNVVVGQFHKTKGEKSKYLKIKIKIF